MIVAKAREPLFYRDLGVPDTVDGRFDLMHHKYVVRDGAGLWSGSTNWTLDSWTLQENVIVTTESPDLAAAFEHDFEGLWNTGRLEGSGGFDAPRVAVTWSRRMRVRAAVSFARSFTR